MPAPGGIALQMIGEMPKNFRIFTVMFCENAPNFITGAYELTGVGKIDY